MAYTVEASTPPNTTTSIGTYNRVAKVGPFVSIKGTNGINPLTGQLAGSDVYSQTTRILKSFQMMLQSIGLNLSHVTHLTRKKAIHG